MRANTKARKRAEPKLTDALDPALAYLPTDISWEVVTRETMPEVYRKASEQASVAFDFETTGTKIHKGARPVSFGLAFGGRGYYFPIDHTRPNTQDIELPKKKYWTGTVEPTDYENLPWKEAVDGLRPILEDPGIWKTGSYIQFDYRQSKVFFKIVIKSLLDIGAPARIKRSYDLVGLKSLMWDELERYPHEEEDLRLFMKVLKLKFPEDMDKVPISVLGPYCAVDVVFTDGLAAKFLGEHWTEKEKDLLELECDLVPILAEMELRGMPVDVPYLQALAKELQIQKGEVVQEIRKEIGFEINPGSDKQLGAYLFGPRWSCQACLEKATLLDGKYKANWYWPQDTKCPECHTPRKQAWDRGKIFTIGGVTIPVGLSLKPPHMTEGGATKEPEPSTKEDVLTTLAGDCPVLNRVLEYRTIDKQLGTYVLGKRGILANTKDGLVFGDIISSGPQSGRLASREPNLMNFTKKFSLIRRAFVANLNGEDCWDLLMGDEEQIEYRVLVHYVNNPELTKVVLDGIDPHFFTASIMFGKPVEEVSPEEREIGKTCLYMMMFGGKAGKLAQELTKATGTYVSFKEAYDLQQLFHQKLPYITSVQTGIMNTVVEYGSVQTYFGLEREFPAAFSFAGVDHVIQGTAAYVLKKGIRTAAWGLRERGMRTYIIVPIHDELYCRYHRDDDLFTVMAVLNDAMTDFHFRVPMTTGWKMSATNWAEAKKISIEEKFLRPEWSPIGDWRDKQCRKLGVSPVEILEKLPERANDLVKDIRDLQHNIYLALRYRHHLLQWHENLKKFKPLWKEAFRAWNAA